MFTCPQRARAYGKSTTSTATTEKKTSQISYISVSSSDNAINGLQLDFSSLNGGGVDVLLRLQELAKLRCAARPKPSATALTLDRNGWYTANSPRLFKNPKMGPLPAVQATESPRPSTHSRYWRSIHQTRQGARATRFPTKHHSLDATPAPTPSAHHQECIVRIEQPYADLR